MNGCSFVLGKNTYVIVSIIVMKNINPQRNYLFPFLYHFPGNNQPLNLVSAFKNLGQLCIPK